VVDPLGVAVDFNPSGVITGSGTYSYKIETTGPLTGNTFNAVGLSADINGLGTASITKEVFGDSGFMTSLGTLTLTYPGVAPAPILLPTGYTDIYIRDNYSTVGDAGIDKITNSLNSVPGPLPILGAGAAFGFSRKLRGRIKAARLS
jgi:hypothetical protein